MEKIFLEKDYHKNYSFLPMIDKFKVFDYFHESHRKNIDKYKAIISFLKNNNVEEYEESDFIASNWHYRIKNNVLFILYDFDSSIDVSIIALNDIIKNEAYLEKRLAERVKIYNFFDTQFEYDLFVKEDEEDFSSRKIIKKRTTLYIPNRRDLKLIEHYSYHKEKHKENIDVELFFDETINCKYDYIYPKKIYANLSVEHNPVWKEVFLRESRNENET